MVKIAIAHDYLTQRGGAERVVLSLLKAFPKSQVYTTLYNPDTTFPEFKDAEIITSRLNAIRPFRQDHRKALPFLPHASNSLRVDADLVICSSTGWAHGFPCDGKKLVYCHSPARFLYLADEYLGQPVWKSASGLALGALRPALVAWDQKAASTADRYLCNSTVIKQRIDDVYGISAAVVPPPAGVVPSGLTEAIPELVDWAEQGWFQIVSRLLPYKNVHVAIDAFRDLDSRLVVIGKGPMGEQLRAAAPSNVKVLSGLSDAQLRWAYQHSLALIATSYEDFGLTPLEAGAFGKPCVALHAGGYLDTIKDGVNGLFFSAAESSQIVHAVQRAMLNNWDSAAIREHVEAFSEEKFISRMQVEAADLLA